jgi:hypothetical protein
MDHPTELDETAGYTTCRDLAQQLRHSAIVGLP